MNRKRICINLTSQRMNFWLQIACILHENFDVVIVASSEYKAIIEKRIQGKFLAFEALERYMVLDEPLNPQSVILEALEYEDRYGTPMTLLMSNTRDLGKGYIFNADCHPDMTSSWWSHEHKIAEFVAKLRFWEECFDRHRPILVVGEVNSIAASLVAHARGAKELGLGFMKFGERYFWTEDTYYQNQTFFTKIGTYVIEYSSEGAEIPDCELELFEAARFLQGQVGNGFVEAARAGAIRIYRETRHRIKRILLKLLGSPLREKPGYRYLGWLPVELRRPVAYRYMQRYGKTPDQLGAYKLVYVPMHLEPEIALMAVSPEFNNTMELISLLSKSLPADHLIVLKEHPMALGVRSLGYYDHLRRISNVVFANMAVSSLDWVRRSAFVTTITGTTAVEAVYFLKPVLSFGKHQPVNLLPTVRYANCLSSVREGVKAMAEISVNDRLLRASRAALHRAQLECSIALPGGAKMYADGNTDSALASTVVESMLAQYSESSIPH